MTVSVIIPTHHRPGLLGEAVASVLNQTWKDLELIIVDEATTDETAQVIRSFFDPRIRSIRNERSLGAAGARNRGASLATGEILSFLDDDDYYLPEKLARTVEAFRRSDKIGVVVSGFTSGRLEVLRAFEGHVFKKLTNRFYTLPTSILAVRRSLFEALGGFDETMPPSEDYEFCLRAAQVTEFASILEPLVFHRQHTGGRLVDDLAGARKTFEKVVRKNLSDPEGRPTRSGRRLLDSFDGQTYAGLARESFASGDSSNARRYIRAALYREPGVWRRWAQFALYHCTPAGPWVKRLLSRRVVKL
jgi:glycosyltransferase involved in cell wall biosynthesis